jgi:hypothetical protein
MKPKVNKFEKLMVWQEARKLNKLLFEELKDCKDLFLQRSNS